MTTETSSIQPPRGANRVVSLDVLRGLNVFLLLFLAIAAAIKNGPLAAMETPPEWALAFVRQFEHVEWRGFTICDLIMPLFIFTAGASVPFSLARYVGPDGKRRDWALWGRILRRVALLWILGMCVQGNLLGLKFENIKLYSNTLQAIAAGYFIACLTYLFEPARRRFGVFVGLLAFFWVGCAIHRGFRGAGLGFEPGTNLAFDVDAAFLGRFRDGAWVDDSGKVVFEDWYQYTWIWSSLTFGATAISGLFAGDLLRSVRAKIAAVEAEADDETRAKSVRRIELKTFATLLGAGILAVVAAFAWDAIPKGSAGYCPIVKKIWTPSMVLLSSGWSTILLAFCYLLYDVWKKNWLKTFLLVLGTNALAAYMLSHLLHFDQIVGWVLYGLEQWLGAWQGVILQVAGFALLWFLLWTMWRNQKFWRV